MNKQSCKFPHFHHDFFTYFVSFTFSTFLDAYNAFYQTVVKCYFDVGHLFFCSKIGLEYLARSLCLCPDVYYVLKELTFIIA